MSETTPNIHALDKPLRFGDPEQVAAVKAIEQGMLICRDCGNLYDPADDDLEHYGWCESCLGLHRCPTCDDVSEEPLWGQDCEWCREERRAASE